MSRIDYNSYEVKMPGTLIKRTTSVVCEVTVLLAAILAVWVLMFIPVVLYFSLKEENGSTTSWNSTLNNSCENQDNSTIVCHEDFFLDRSETGQCRPHCERWNLFSGVSETLSFAVIGLSMAIGLITTIVIIILSFVRYRSMLKFPSVMVIYQNAAVSTYGMVILIGLMDRSLFCTSPDLIKALAEPVSPLCAISDFMIIYAVLPLAVWITMQIAFILIGVYFPFYGQRLLASKWKRRSLHVFALVLGLLFPLPTIIVSSITGHSLFGPTFPPVVCTSQRRDIMIFTWLIPVNVLLAVIITMLIFIFYKVVKSRGCFTKSKESGGATVEIKVLIIAFSYIFVGLVATTSFAVSSSRIEILKQEVLAYFHCERCGVNYQLGENCTRSGFERFTNDTLVTMAYSLFGLYSLITLVYVVRVSDLKKCSGMIWKRFRSLKSGSTMMSQMASEDIN